MSTEVFPQQLQWSVEQFVYHEAALLDAWELDDWVRLLADDLRYVVPATDDLTGDPESSLVLLDDDIVRARARVERLKSRRAHREFPWSRTRRLISNVRVTATGGDEVEAQANFVVYRIRKSVVAYVGCYKWRLRAHEGSFLIVHRRVELDLESLRPHGTLSIIL